MQYELFVRNEGVLMRRRLPSLRSVQEGFAQWNYRASRQKLRKRLQQTRYEMDSRQIPENVSLQTVLWQRLLQRSAYGSL